MKSVDRYENNIGISVLYIALVCLGIYLMSFFDARYDKHNGFPSGQNQYIELEGVKPYPITVQSGINSNLSGFAETLLASIDVKSGDKISLYRDAPTEVSSMSALKRMALGIPININSASAGELDALPGIGPVLSGRIVRYRESGEGFSSPEDIMNVHGVGLKKYRSLKVYVTAR